jgi:hypothetical protein
VAYNNEVASVLLLSSLYAFAGPILHLLGQDERIAAARDFTLRLLRQILSLALVVFDEDEVPNGVDAAGSSPLLAARICSCSAAGAAPFARALH